MNDRGRKWLRILCISLLAFFLVIVIYLMAGGTQTAEVYKTYNALVEQNSGQGTIDKKLMFVAAYVKATGDVTIAQKFGYDTDQIEEVINPADPTDPDDMQDPDIPETPVIPPGSNEDYRPYAMQAAIDEINMNIKTHHTKNTECNHNPIECYSYQESWHGTLYGMTKDWYPCCATGCWLINLAAGNGRGGNQAADGARTGFTQKSSSGLTYADLPVGAVTASSGHEQMVVYRDDATQTVYVASFGSCTQICKCRDQGYSKTFSYTDTISFAHVWIPN